MPRLTQKGFAAQLLILIILVVGLAVGFYLVKTQTNLLPKANVSGPVTSQESYSLVPQQSNYTVGQTIEVKLLVRSDLSAANLFSTKINYDPTYLQLGRVDTTSFITNWVEQYWGDLGKISLVGGVPNPGYQTNVNSEPGKMATLYFTALKPGSTSITFADGTAIYRNSDNEDILSTYSRADVNINSTSASPSPTPVAVTLEVTPTTIPVGGKMTFSWSGVPDPLIGDYIFVYNSNNNIVDSPRFWTNNCTQLTADAPKASGTCADMPVPATPDTYYMILYSNHSNNNNMPLARSNNFTVISASPIPSATPVPGTGDGNSDGKINLIDLSVLLSDYNKNSGFRTSIDLNRDGVVNAFDFSLMRNLLIQKGVIKG